MTYDYTPIYIKASILDLGKTSSTEKHIALDSTDRGKIIMDKIHKITINIFVEKNTYFTTKQIFVNLYDFLNWSIHDIPNDKRRRKVSKLLEIINKSMRT